MSRLLLSNDDGVHSPGIHAMAVALRDAGHDVVIVAPSGERSGWGAGVGTLVGHEHDAGIPAIDDYIESYVKRTGRQSLANLNVYLAFNFFRLAAILQGILGRVRDGTAANAEAAAMAQDVIPLARTGWALARKAGA